MNATQPIPADLQALHAQIVDCEAQGFTYLAAALRPMLDRQIRERGLAVSSAAEAIASAKEAQNEAEAVLATLKPISIRLLPPPQMTP